MKPLATLKSDIEFNKNLSVLIEVLKTIAVTQYRALEQTIKIFEILFKHANSFFEIVNADTLRHPFFRPRTKKTVSVAITSDSGLLGGLNSSAVNSAIKELQKSPGKLVVIGERGKRYAQEAGIPFAGFGGISEEESARHAQSIQLRDYLVKAFIEEGAGYLKVAYPHPFSFTVQRVQTVSFLPYVPPKEYAERAKTAPDVIFESSPQDAAEYVIYLWIGEKLHEILGLSRLAEFAARFVHLEESSGRLKEVDKALRLEYNRARRELVDRNLRDLFGARSIYAGK